MTSDETAVPQAHALTLIRSVPLFSSVLKLENTEQALDRAGAKPQPWKPTQVTVHSDHTGVQIHETAVVDPRAVIGSGTSIWHFSHVMDGAKVGTNCVLGQNVMIAAGASVGKGVKIQNNVSVFRGVTLEDDVFCGPSMVFTNVLTPRAFVDRKSEFASARVCQGATIGANATIVCGNTIGKYAMVGAGSVVTKNVRSHALVLGSPAREVGWVSRTGGKLGDDLICPRTGEKYRHGDDGLERVE